jgi:23S rRNA (pseudouridine1915-N3)-methyltransferase
VKCTVVCVGKPGRVLEAAIAEYESRARRYWPLDVVEVREERARKGTSEAAVRDAEAERILRRVPKGAGLIALTRTGRALGSVQLAEELERHGTQAGGDLAWVIGGAFGLGSAVLDAARSQLRLSNFTLPHDLARLLLMEQLYRAGTILRNEPYHKGGDET